MSFVMFRHKVRIFIFLSILLNLLPTSLQLAGKPNIVFILVDDLGWNDVSWHNPQVLTPNLNALAEEGVILEQAYAQPTCSPSRAALLTGYHASRTGFQFLPQNSLEPVGLPTSFSLMPKLLSDLGYSSHGLGKWHLGYCSPDYFPSNRGFDSYLGYWNGVGEHLTHTIFADSHDTRASLGYDFFLNGKLFLGALGHWIEDIFVDRVGDILASRAGLTDVPHGKVHMENYNSSNPFFFYLSYQNVHAPLEVAPKYSNLYPDVEEKDRKTYLGMVSAVDDSVGRILQQLRDYTYTTEDGLVRDLYSDTVFVFSSDNGGMSAGLGYAGADNTPLRGRKGDTWEGGCRVPSFISGINATGMIDSMFHITDWLPTLYAGVAGGDIQNLGEIDGFNQLPVLQGKEEPMRNEILYDIANFLDSNITFYMASNWPGDFEVSGSFGAALRVGKYKLILGCSTIIGCSRNYNSTWEGNTDNDRVLLFDLETDPGEQEDLVEVLPEVVEELRSRLDVHLARAVKPAHRPLDQAGNPKNHFPPGQFFSGWCESDTYPEPQ